MIYNLFQKILNFFINKVYAIDIVDNVITPPNGASNMNTSIKDIKDILGSVLLFSRWAGLAICIIMLVWCAVKLATSAGNTQKRALAMDGIKNVLIAVAIIGSATVIVTVAYGILKQ